MPRNKKRKTKEQCLAQFKKTVKKTGKWRGKKVNQYA